MNWLGWWLTGPLRKLLLAQEIRRSEQQQLGLEGRAACASLTSVGNDKAAPEPQVAGYWTVLTWERKSKPYIKGEFTFRFKSVAEDHRGVQSAVLAKCIQLPLQMSLINWENPVSLNIQQVSEVHIESLTGLISMVQSCALQPRRITSYPSTSPLRGQSASSAPDFGVLLKRTK